MSSRRVHPRPGEWVAALALLAAGTLAMSPREAPAQARDDPPAPESRRTESRVAAHAMLGVFVPSGGRRALGNAAYIGAQVAARLRPGVALVSGLAASQSADSRLASTDARVTLWQYDAGIELAPWRGVALRFGDRRIIPFLGAGAGGRSYDYDQRGVRRHDALAGYMSTGLELRGSHGAGMRAEARAYVSHGERDDRNGLRADGVFAVGLTYHFQ